MGLPAIKLDTLSLSKELEEVGIPKSHAEAQIKSTVKVINMVIEDKLVTKDDLVAVENRLSKRIGHLDKEFVSLDKRLSERLLSLEYRMEALTLKMTVRLGGIIVAGIMVLGALIKF